MVQFLLSKNADVHQRTNVCSHIPCISQYDLCLLSLSCQYGDTALIFAAQNGHTAVVEELLKSKAKIDGKNEVRLDGDTI